MLPLQALRTKNRAFTLIELLVVIAIIGILAQTVMSSVTNARLEAKNAKIKQTMSTMRSKGELFYSTSGYNNYGRSYMKMAASCRDFLAQAGDGFFATTTAGIGTQLQDILTLMDDPVNDVKCIAGNSVSEWTYVNGGAFGASSWAVSVKNPKNPLNSFCTDFTGVFKEIPNTNPINAVYQSGLDGQPFSPAVSSNPQNDARCI